MPVSTRTQTSLTLAKEKRIRKRRDFLRVQKHGFRAFGRFFVLIAQEDQIGKIGITVPKKVGKAHERNLIKRRVRHVFRHQEALFKGKSLVIVAKPAAALASFADLAQDIVNVCSRIKIERKSRFFRPRKPLEKVA